MAIDMNKDGKVGCAYYCALDETLYLEEDIAMGGIETVETLLVSFEPTSLFIPNRASGALVEFVERDAHRFDDGETTNGNHGSYVLRHLTSAQFDYEVAKEIMAELDFEPYERGSVRTESTEKDAIEHICSASHTKLMRLAKIINLDSCLSIGCAGAVLTDLERRRTAENPNPGDEGNTPFRIRAIVMNYSEDTMLISADSLMSLQITQSELHPNPYSQCPDGSEPTAKGSLSIIALIQSLASTAQGKRRLRQLLLRPSTNINVIQERQTSIGILLRPENAEVTKDMRKLLRKLKDNKALLLHVRKGIDKVRGRVSIRIRDWEALLRFVMITSNLYDAAGTLYGAEEVTIFARIRQEVDVSNFIALSRDIMATFDFQASKDSGHTQILPTASELLEILWAQYAEVLDLLPQLRDAQREEIPLWAHKHILGCSLMRGFGFVILVTPDRETDEGMYFGHDGDEWERVSVNEKAVVYRTRYTREFDSQYGDLLQYIAEEEMFSVLDLAYKVLEHEESILHALELYGELDSLLAFAAAAEKYDWVAPRMTTANVIDIDEGRHPLQELLVPVFIPNGCGLKGGEGRAMLMDEVLSSENGHNGEEKPSVLILTGPNNSGKSIYMKQVALIVYLAHTGSFVPAQQATIGITDRILTRIATRESVIAEESAFMADVKQAAFSMNFSTRQSLLLIDEFGKGTTASNGATLLTAYLTYFLKLGAERPKILVGTHFHEIFENDLLQEQQGVALAHMEVRLDRKAEDIEDQITFLHRLLPGRGPKSLGIMCAELNGIPPHILDRAEDMVEFMEGHADLMAAIDVARRQEIKRRASLFIKRLLGIGKSELNNSGCNVRELLREVLEFKGDDNESSEDEAEAEENYGADWGHEEDDYAEDMGDEAYYDESVEESDSEYYREHEYDEAEAMEEDSQDDNAEETNEFIDDSLSSENGMECDENNEELRQASEPSEFNGFGSFENYGGLRNSGGSKHFGQNAQEDVGMLEEYEMAYGRMESESFGSSSRGDGIEDDDAEDFQESEGVMDWSPSMYGSGEAEDSREIQDYDDIDEVESFEDIEGSRDIRRSDDIGSYDDIQSSEDDHDSEDVEGSENIHEPQGLEAAQYDEDLEEYEDSEIFEGFEETEGSTDFEGFGSSPDVQGIWMMT
ncbi:muts domain V-domain-containing protein [Cladorrhinum sp. PSN259]|nr:muts domain V-domain-containing protein [Cladorrhinum sp. PSN259]